MKPELKNTVLRSALALLVLLGGAPSSSAIDLIVPPQDGRKAGNDGVGGIEKTKPGSGLPGGPQVSGGQSGPLMPASVDEGAWGVLGEALGGSAGLPQLSGEGSGASGAPVAFKLQSCVPGGKAMLIIGVTALGVPFKGGTLIPSPNFVMPGIPLDSQGACTLPAMLPPSLPTGFVLYVQAWIADPGAAQGFASSNGLSLTVQ